MQKSKCKTISQNHKAKFKMQNSKFITIIFHLRTNSFSNLQILSPLRKGIFYQNRTLSEVEVSYLQAIAFFDYAQNPIDRTFPSGLNLQISKSSNLQISTSSHQHISTSSHQHIIPSSHQHISTLSHHHIITLSHQHINQHFLPARSIAVSAPPRQIPWAIA